MVQRRKKSRRNQGELIVLSNNKYKYLAKNTILFSISSFGSKILSFLFVSLYTIVLSTEEYGTADLVWTTSSLILFFVTLNISDAVVRFAIEKTDEQVGIFSYGLRVIIKGQLIFGILLLIFGYLNPIEWDWSLYVFLYLTVLINSIYQVSTYYLKTFDEIKSVAIAGILNTAVTIFSNIILLIILRTGVDGYLSSLIIGGFISSVYAFYVIRKKDKFDWSKICDRETKRMMLSYSIPLIFNGISWWLNNSLDRYLITYFCGVSINGIYAVASKIPTMLTTIQSIFAEAWNLSAIKEFDKDDSDGFFGNTYSFYNAFCVIFASGLIILNVFIARILFAKDFFLAWEYSSVLVVSVVFSGLAGFAGSIFSVVKKTGFYSLSTVVAAMVNTGLNIILIPLYGALGAAVATLISFVIVWLIRVIYARKFIAWKINYYKDIIAYSLLVLQLFIEHTDNHCYIVQLLIFISLMLLYKEEVAKILVLIKNKLRKK